MYLLIFILRLLARGKGSAAKENSFIAAFSICMLCYLLAPFPFQFEEMSGLAFPFLFGAWATPYCFWLMAQRLSADKFQLKPFHIVGILTLEAIQFTLFYTAADPMPHWKIVNNSFISFIVHILIPRLLSASFLIIALWQSKRNWFIFSIGSLCLVIISAEIINYTFPHSQYLEAFTTFLCIVLIYRLSEEALRSKPFWTCLSRPSQVHHLQEIELQLIEMIKEKKLYMQQGITLRQLAKELKVPEYKLRKVINQNLGHHHFKSFLNYYRVKAAQEMLTQPENADIPIYNLAFDMGFSSLASFNRAFKNQVGMAPSSFRLQHQQ